MSDQPFVIQQCKRGAYIVNPRIIIMQGKKVICAVPVYSDKANAEILIELLNSRPHPALVKACNDCMVELRGAIDLLKGDSPGSMLGAIGKMQAALKLSGE